MEISNPRSASSHGLDIHDFDIDSKRRVVDHSEVFTNEREIEGMLNLVEHETQRLESRFLEPACGTGNFLAEILIRKLLVIDKTHAGNNLETERRVLIALSSLYGIEILLDNVLSCRMRLESIVKNFFVKVIDNNLDSKFSGSVRKILELNIVHGDATSLKFISGDPIIFPEWSFVNESMLKRRDFSFGHLIEFQEIGAEGLFSDLGSDVFIPTPVKNFPLVSFLEIENAF